MMLQTKRLISLLLLVCLIGCKNDEPTTDLLVIEGNTMGTTFVVKMVKNTGQMPDLNSEELETAIDEILLQVNQQMSTYLPDSEISQFNRSEGSDWFAISSDFARVLTAALEIAKKSNGAFDPTVGPLVNLWGFGPEHLAALIPSDEEIRKKKALTGYEKIAVRAEPPAVRKTLPGVYCDLSAIAKGFGVDRVAEYLETSGITNYMVEIGGEVRVKGRGPTGQMWRIGVESPDDPSGLQMVLHLKDNALATSGDYFNYFEKDGVRYSHTIDPRTGKPIMHKLASVTVLHKSCMLADGFATAINVLGPVDGFELAVQQELLVYLIVRGEHGFEEKMTPAFENFIFHKN
ncbi:MAG: FAD:protein FMN transferase [bacterium]